LRRPELHAHVEVTHSRPVDARKPTTAKVKHLPAMRTRRNRHRHGRGDRRRRHIATENERGVRNQRLGVEIFAVPREALIALHVEHYDPDAARAAARSGVTHTAKCHVLAGGHTGRDLHLHFAIPANPPLTAAVVAGSGNSNALSSARGAWRHAHELTEERPLRAPHLAGATAGLTTLR